MCLRLVGLNLLVLGEGKCEEKLLNLWQNFRVTFEFGIRHLVLLRMCDCGFATIIVPGEVGVSIYDLVTSHRRHRKQLVKLVIHLPR